MTPRLFASAGLAACLLVLASCATPVVENTGVDEPTLSWQFRETRGLDTPLGDAILVVNGQSHVIAQGTAGGWKSLVPSDYAGWGVPVDAATAALSWWAGGGEVLYATYKNGATVVYRKIVEEGMRGERFKVLKTIR